MTPDRIRQRLQKPEFGEDKLTRIPCVAPDQEARLSGQVLRPRASSPYKVQQHQAQSLPSALGALPPAFTVPPGGGNRGVVPPESAVGYPVTRWNQAPIPMTVEQPTTMSGWGAQEGGKMYATHSSHMFHDYSMSQQPVPDHSLHTDLNMCASSPNSLCMYEESDFHELPSSLPSSCEGSGGMTELSQLDDFDLKPQFECNDDLLKLDPSSIGASFEDMSRGDPVWSPTEPTSMLLKMEDVFQVERSDVVQGPTLAELNCDDSMSLFEDIESVWVNRNESNRQDCKPNLWPSVSSNVFPTCSKNVQKMPTCTVTNSTLSLPSSTCHMEDANKMADGSSYTVTGKIALYPQVDKPKLSSTCAYSSSDVQEEDSKSSLHQLLTQKENAALKMNSATNQSTPVATLTKAGVKRSLSPGDGSNEVSGNSVDRKWEEIKQFIHDEDAVLAASKEPPVKVIKTEPEDPAFTPIDDVKSQEDEGFDSDSGDSDADTCYDDNDFLSDAESLESQGSFSDEYPIGKKQQRYFWQYNTQSKGPKGKRLCKSVDTRDPHVLNDFEDPVFDPDLNQMQYKHNGKARRGDGNDITPNAHKLFQIGNELKKLNRVINDLTPVSELPVNARPRSRKEKNKLASRACRLKKKAQHEANKVKLYGLHREHQNLMAVLDSLKRAMQKKIDNPDANDGEMLATKVEKLVQSHLTHMIAGHTTEYVNTILAKVTAGDPTGGLHV